MFNETQRTEAGAVSILDLLLRSEVPNVQKELPTARYKVKRLSETVGEPVVLELRGLPYGRVEELRELSEDTNVHIVLAGVTNVDFKALAGKYGVITPAEAVKALFLPGEIEDLSRAVERLCGYRRNTIEEVKNA